MSDTEPGACPFCAWDHPGDTHSKACVIGRHVDGEQARQDAAVAAAREEQREADARFIRSDEATWDSAHELDEVIRTSPLTATPLADHIAELEERMAVVLHAGPSTALAVSVFDRAKKAEARVAELEGANRYLTERLDAAGDLLERLGKAEAEHDRLAVDALAALAGAGVATPQEGYTAAPFLLKGDIGRLAAERDALRAQVEAARAECEAIRCGSDCDSSSCYDSECHAARAILAAMGGGERNSVTGGVMGDDVKGFRERITAAMERIAAGHSPMRIPADMTDPDIVLSDCLARIEGEAARTAEAVAAETALCARQCAEALERSLEDEREVSQSLREQLIAAEARVAAATSAARKVADRWVDEKDRADYATAALRLYGFRQCDIAACNCGSWHAPPNLRAEKAEAERDHWKGRWELDSSGFKGVIAEKMDRIAEGSKENAGMRLDAEERGREIAALASERDVLRAQVEAARALCADFDRGGGLMWPGEVLAAMDGAKP